jgi:hypothetical protein
LRVDELAKLGGRACLHQRPEGGCAVHARRPPVCRAYRCAWLSGAFEERDRPDRLGAVFDLVPRGDEIRLVVRLRVAGSLDGSARLHEIVEETRRSMPVEVRDVDDVLDPDRGYRLLQPNGEDLEIAGDRVRTFRDGHFVSERRAPLLARLFQRFASRIRARLLRRWPSHEDRLAHLGLPGVNLRAPRAPHEQQEEKTS